jgi:hypothetical protein
MKRAKTEDPSSEPTRIVLLDVGRLPERWRMHLAIGVEAVAATGLSAWTEQMEKWDRKFET